MLVTPQRLHRPNSASSVAVFLELLERTPAVGLLGELVRRLLDRLLKRSLFGKQPEHHAKAPKI